MQQPIKEDFFKTITTSSTGDYKDKGSKFLAFAYPVKSIGEVKARQEELKKKFYDARHFCFAYRINPEKPQIRSNDDGEPSNSAGAPILNQLQSFELWNVVVFVVRYFGGTKLGVSGLISAYKGSAHEALESADIITEYITNIVQIRFPYKLMNEVSRLIKENELKIVQEEMDIVGGYSLAVRKHELENVLRKLSDYHEIQIL